MLRRCAPALLAVLILSGPASAADTVTSWRIDPGHSSAEFSVRHLVITNVKGTIPIKAGVVETAAGSQLPISVNATLDAAGLDTKNGDRDSDLHGPRWFDVAQFPTIVFVSTKVSGTPEAFTVVGALTIHGVTKDVTLTGKALGTITDSRGNVHIGYEATTTFDRRDFGLTFMGQNGGALIAATDVSITLEVEAISRPS
jgi:polyisoprenoid-binding protein YceI